MSHEIPQRPDEQFEDYQQVLPCRVELITSIEAEFTKELQAAGWMEEDMVENMNVALREALTNAMTHGSLGIRLRPGQSWQEQYDLIPDEVKDSKKVGFSRHVSPERVEVDIKDEGTGFDSEQVPDPTGSPEALLKSSGRGIFFMRRFFDEVTITNENGTRVVMVKNRPSTQK